MHLIRPRTAAIILAPILLAACTATDLARVAETVSQASLSEREVAGGLKDALVQGITRGVEQAARVDGFWGDDRIRILLPPDAARIESTLRQLGLGSEVDRALMAMNRAAETAAREALPVFTGAIRELTIQDAWAILRGEPDAATRYLERTTTDALTGLFMPRVEAALRQVEATRYYGDLVSVYNALPTTRNRLDPELGAYVTRRAIEGLFSLMADEEQAIREAPAARGTALMRRVFAAQD